MLKHAAGRLDLITRPSNREGLKDGFGGLRAVPIFFWAQSWTSQSSRYSLKIGTGDVDGFIRGQGLFGEPAIPSILTIVYCCVYTNINLAWGYVVLALLRLCLLRPF